MIYISASLITDMLSCSMKGHHRKHNKDKAILTMPMIMGQITHESIEKYTNDENLALEHAKNELLKYNCTDKESKNVELMLKTYFKAFVPLLSEGDLLEQKFRFKFDSDVTILGIWDRISEGDIVWDWKTTKTPPKSIDNNPQFIVYYQAYKEIFGKYPAAVFYGSLTKAKPIKFNPVKQNISLLFDEIIPSLINKIRNEDFIHDGMVRYEYQCPNCIYKMFCFEALGKAYTE